MRISQIVIDPGHGYRDDKWDDGHKHGNLSEVEIIDAYRHNVEEEIYMEGVRCIVIDSRNAKGHIVECPEASLVLRLHAGFNPLGAAVNMSQVLYGSPEAKELAERLARSCFEWGKRVNWVHGNGGAKLSKEIAHEGSLVVELHPVLINGPATSEVYFKQLIHLGTHIGSVAALYAKSFNSSLGFRPRRVPERVSVTRKTPERVSVSRLSLLS